MSESHPRGLLRGDRKRNWNVGKERRGEGLIAPKIQAPG